MAALRAGQGGVLRGVRAHSWQRGCEAAGVFIPDRGQGEVSPPALAASSEPPQQEFKLNSLFITCVLLAVEAFLLKKKKKGYKGM